MVDALAARGAIIFVVIEAEVAQADFGADVDAVAGNPLVTVGEAAAIERAFVAVVFHGTEGKVAEVVGGSHAVKPEVVTFEGFTQPVAELRLNEPMFHLTVVLVSERVKVAVDGNAQVLMETVFESDVRGGRQPIKSIGVDRPLLGIGLRCIYK